MRREAFKFWDLVRLILETLRYLNFVMYIIVKWTNDTGNLEKLHGVEWCMALRTLGQRKKYDAFISFILNYPQTHHPNPNPRINSLQIHCLLNNFTTICTNPFYITTIKLWQCLYIWCKPYSSIPYNPYSTVKKHVYHIGAYVGVYHTIGSTHTADFVY